KTNLQCSAPPNTHLHFKRTTDKNWIKATEIKCENDEWQLKYKDGSKVKSEKLLRDDRVICATEHFCKNVCPSYRTFKYEGQENYDYK
ncbi:hypothetical protein PFISCL1PPCAC_21629, partial [Pristionchus fissidentatus]